MTILFWIGFFLLVSLLLAVDLGSFHAEAHEIGLREATLWTVVWITTALLFNLFVWGLYTWNWLGMGEELGGNEAALQFLTAYLIEKSLSMDNIFVMAVIFGHFGIRPKYQHRVLFWGVLGAIVMRVVLIVVGVALIRRFEWIIYVFGALLLGAAVKMALTGPGRSDPERNWLVRLIRRRRPVVTDPEGAHLFVRRDGRWAVTTLLLALIVIESADLLFAVDSIPAVFGVTRAPFIAVTSNVLAILGLRALYFVLAGLLRRMRFLHPALVGVLLFIGVKMLLAGVLHIPTLTSLGIVVAILGAGSLASFLAPGGGGEPPSPDER